MYAVTGKVSVYVCLQRAAFAGKRQQFHAESHPRAFDAEGRLNL